MGEVFGVSGSAFGFSAFDGGLDVVEDSDAEGGKGLEGIFEDLPGLGFGEYAAVADAFAGGLVVFVVGLD